MDQQAWLTWLYEIGYPFDWAADTPPPCSPEELARVWREREDGGEHEPLEAWTALVAEEGGWPS